MMKRSNVEVVSVKGQSVAERVILNQITTAPTTAPLDNLRQFEPKDAISFPSTNEDQFVMSYQEPYV